VRFTETGITQCAIEQAHAAGAIDYKKPISCHLYPIRAKKYGSYVAMNYHDWDICGDACKAGSEMNVPVYVFLKEALTRKMGAKWYTALEEVAAAWEAQKSAKQAAKALEHCSIFKRLGHVKLQKVFGIFTTFDS
jgi:hypothetical protein